MPCEVANRRAFWAEFRPALRTEQMLKTMFAADGRWRPPAFVPAPLRALVESIGYRSEIRYVWPGRVIATGVGLSLIVLVGAKAAQHRRKARRYFLTKLI